MGNDIIHKGHSICTIDEVDTTSIEVVPLQSGIKNIYFVEPKSVKIKSLTVHSIDPYSAEKNITIKGLNSDVLRVMTNTSLSYNLAIRLAKLLIHRYNEIRKIHPNIYEDHFIAGSVMFAI